MKAARARSAASVWNVGKRVPTPLVLHLLSGCGVARGSTSSGRNREALSTVAAHAGGPACSSGETPVMGVERRGRLIYGLFARAAGGLRLREETSEQVRFIGQAVYDTQAAGMGGIQARRGQ
jgi:hypothetical protein